MRVYGTMKESAWECMSPYGEGYDTVQHHEGRAMRVYGTMRGRPMRL